MRFMWSAVMAVTMMTGLGAAQQPAAAGANTGKTFLLWPQGAPGAKGTEDLDKPTLAVYLPTAANPTKTGVIVAPGGSYSHLSMDKEGAAVAQWLNDRGVAAFVLKYRLGDRYRYPVALEDAQRAIRMVRANAAEYGVSVDHVGMWGFSAGGHLAASAGTHFEAGNPAAADVIDRQPSKPDFLILAYPVMTMQAPYVHPDSKTFLIGNDASQKLMDETSMEMHVTENTPPAFIFATADDPKVPVMNSVLFYEALVKAKVPVEMHLFQHGAHGAGLATGNPQLSPWTGLMMKWMRERGYAGPDPAAAATQ